MINKKNYYGNLTTIMYEILHKDTPKEELKFYLSYANKADLILEPLCGSGRFLIPFYDLGYNVIGLDNSKEMLERLHTKNENIKTILSDLESFKPNSSFNYIFITSGSVSLFTDPNKLKQILINIYNLLEKDGKFVFAVDTIKTKMEDDKDYIKKISVKTDEGYNLILKSKNFFAKKTKIQYSPSIYELYDNKTLLKKEYMDFQIRLYELGEIELILDEIGFKKIIVYSNFEKKIAISNDTEMFLYECRK